MTSPFNSALETGIRSLLLLTGKGGLHSDLQRLVYYDYVMVHSGDVSNGPPSIHPPTPYRSGELLVRRQLIEDGLLLMVSRNLVARQSTSGGFTYAATDIAETFLTYLTSPYTLQLRERAKWVLGRFGEMTDQELAVFFTERLQSWGSEFFHVAMLDE